MVEAAGCELCESQAVNLVERGKVSRFGFAAKGRVREPCSLNPVMGRIHRTHTRPCRPDWTLHRYLLKL